MKKLISVAVLFLVSVSQAQVCQKSTDSKNLDGCFASPALKWAFPFQPLTVDEIRKGPSVKPALTNAELESGIVFCQYFFHKFDSPGSAKFLCARTTAEGVLLNKKGNPVPEARSVSTREMNLKADLKDSSGNIRTVSVGEAVLLDRDSRPMIEAKANGAQELMEADEIKVKYFVNADQYQDSAVRRGDYELTFDQRKIKLANTFVGPTEITNMRWTEVFTEVAATRVLWALGLPADVMIPVKQVVCFGCNSHPKDQTQMEPQKISVFNSPVLERKFEGKKVGEQFNFNRVIQRNLQRWSPAIRHDFEALGLASQLISFHNFIPLQNRVQCEDGKFDKATQTCHAPIALLQDVGSTFGGKTARGSIREYQKARAFSDAATCSLFYPVKGRSFDFFSAQMSEVSFEGIQKFKQRLQNLTPEAVRAIFETARFGEMEPGIRNSMPGTPDQQRNAVIQVWSDLMNQRISEILAISNCQPVMSNTNPY